MKSVFRQTAFPEAYIWILGILVLALINPQANGWTICPLNNLGFEHCPGCGLGRSVSYLLQGDFQRSWEMHPLGGIALVVLISRSLFLLITNTTIKLNQQYGTSN